MVSNEDSAVSSASFVGLPLTCIDPPLRVREVFRADFCGAVGICKYLRRLG